MLFKRTIAILGILMTLNIVNASAQQSDFNYRSSSPPQGQIQPNAPTTNTLELPPLLGPHLPPLLPPFPLQKSSCPQLFLVAGRGTPERSTLSIPTTACWSILVLRENLSFAMRLITRSKFLMPK